MRRGQASVPHPASNSSVSTIVVEDSTQRTTEPESTTRRASTDVDPTSQQSSSDRTEEVGHSVIPWEELDGNEPDYNAWQ
jgi:hypothetical protein